MSRHSDRSKAFQIYISNDTIINLLQGVKRNLSDRVVCFVFLRNDGHLVLTYECRKRHDVELL